MKKRIFVSLMAVMVLVSLMTPVALAASASDVTEECYLSIDIDKEIERALNGETDVMIDATDFAEAVLEREDGTKENVKVYTTTRALPVPMSVYSGGTVYATTAVAALLATDKTDVSTGSKEYVTATITLYWTDVLGLYNEFRGVSGSWTVATNPDTGKKATLSERKVSLRGAGPTAKDEGDWYSISPSSDSFEIQDNEYEDGWWAYEAISKVKINSKEVLSVSVSSGQIVIG